MFYISYYQCLLKETYLYLFNFLFSSVKSQSNPCNISLLFLLIGSLLRLYSIEPSRSHHSQFFIMHQIISVKIILIICDLEIPKEKLIYLKPSTF